MTPTLQGEDYRALRRLSDRDNVTLADVGETCARVPASSLPALLASGKIELVVERRADLTTAVEPPRSRKARE